MKLNCIVLSLATAGLLALPVGAAAQSTQSNNDQSVTQKAKPGMAPWQNISETPGNNSQADRSSSTTTWGGQNQSSQSQVENKNLPQSDQGPSQNKANQSDKNLSGKLSMGEQRFLKQAAEDDQGEVQLAKLAQQKASSQQVKDMAQKIEQQHQQNLDQLKSLAQQKGVQLPDKPEAKQSHEISRLKNLNGAAFDNAYSQFLAKEHKQDIQKFQSEQSKAKDPDVKAYIEKTLPVLQQHEQMAMHAEQGKASSASSKPNKY